MKKNISTYCVMTVILLTMLVACVYGIAYGVNMKDKLDQRESINKQTIDEFKSDIDYWSMGYADLEDRIAELEEENTKLKEEVQKYSDENEELKKVVSDYEEEAEKKAEAEKALVASTKKVETKYSTAKSKSADTKSSLSESDIYLLAQLIYLEGGATSYKCQLAIGSVALNLMRADGVSLKTEIYTPGRFSVASSIPYTTPSDTSLNAARELATSGTTLPSNVKCFRNNYYFSWCTPYCCIDNVYFGSY